MPTENLRIGVFVCDCGSNIAGAVDTEAVREYAATLPGVVAAVRNKYTCADPGQQEIQRTIYEQNLNRVVVASCSPTSYEPIFRQCIEGAGLNPYLLEMANVREHCSWVTPGDRALATDKAKDIVNVAVARARWLYPQDEEQIPVTDAALVIGGGVAGMQAALDLADSGHKVYLVEKRPSIGGIMAQLDKVYPDIECSIWILGPKMMDVGRHPQIELLAYSEIEDVAGYVGNFRVRIRQKARYVDENECTACGDCAMVCPVVVPDEFQMGLGSRKAIHIPFPQAVPSAYVVISDECLGQNPIACGKCIDACEKRCIDFDMQDRFLDLEVGTVIVATGMDVYDPTALDEYGYTRFPNVVTSMEFERLVSTGGPLAGHWGRPGDLEMPKRIGFIQCVGSRTQDPGRGNPYCSNVCCMNTVKEAQYLKDNYPDIDLTVFYMDMRAFGKGFEELLMRSKMNGVRYIRGLPGEVREHPDNGNLFVTVENTTANRLEIHEFEMLVLAVGATPATETEAIRQLVSLSKSPSGFLKEAHPKLRPVDTPTKGVYIAGAAESPKDVRESVTQASAAASRASILLNKPRFAVEAITAVVDEDLCKKCGQCAGVCPFGAIWWEKKQVARVTSAACAGCGTCAAECKFDAIEMRHFSDQAVYAQIDAILENDPLDKIVTFACNWCSYAGADTAGVARMAYPPHARIIRTMCSGRVSADFVWYAFKKGAPVVLVSGCHYVDCHYLDANRSTVRRVDGLWDGLEKASLRPERLQLEWCSAAEGGRWQTIMTEVERKRQAVTPQEVAKTREVLAQARVPGPRNPRPRDIGQPADYACLRCGHRWSDLFEIKERTCLQCRSNSVRWLR